MAKSNEIAVRLKSDIAQYRSLREDDRLREFGVSLPGVASGNGDSAVVATVEEGKKPGYDLTSGGDITRFRVHQFPDIGDVELTIGIRGISVEAAETCIEGLTLTLLDLTGILNANKENTDR